MGMAARYPLTTSLRKVINIDITATAAIGTLAIVTGGMFDGSIKPSSQRARQPTELSQCSIMAT